MESWKQVLPDYKIIKWDESNFKINDFPYVKAAYQANKWAFVSDYVRVWVLYNIGGIYLDTDYQILRSLDEYLDKEVFLGVENNEYVGTAIMGAKKGNGLLKEMLDYYDNNPFEISAGKYNMIPNTMVLTDLLEKRGYYRGNSEMISQVYIAEKDTFYPALQKDNYTADVYGIHYFRGSWWSDKERSRANSRTYKNIIRPLLIDAKKAFIKILGTDKARKLEMRIKNLIK